MKHVVVTFAAVLLAGLLGCIAPGPEAEGDGAAVADRAIATSASPGNEAADTLTVPVELSAGTQSTSPGTCTGDHDVVCATASGPCGACHGPHGEAWRWAGGSTQRCNSCGCSPCPPVSVLCQSC